MRRRENMRRPALRIFGAMTDSIGGSVQSGELGQLVLEDAGWVEAVHNE